MPDETENPAQDAAPASSAAGEAELLVLRFLSQESGDPAACRAILELLQKYRFTTLSRQILFDCLRQLPPGRPELIAAELPARLVRLGFPDFDSEDYLSGPAPDAVLAHQLCRQLLSAVNDAGNS
jgi:hypothetical protein